jgi:hypothetical protein
LTREVHNSGRSRALCITTEFGAGLALTIGATGLYFWQRRKQLPAREETYS